MFYVDQFLSTVGVYPSRLNSFHFQKYLDNYIFTSTSQQNQVISAIKFLYQYGLNKKYNKVCFKRPRKESKIPVIIDKEFLIDKISKITNLKHKAIITIGYSVGLRVSEVVNLKISDIDSNRMVITVCQAKGKKDRIVPLTENTLSLLRQYYKQHKPKKYLFNGQKSLKYTSGSCNKIVKKYLGNKYHFHLLRHSCFTNLTDEGVDLRVIQKLAGHKNSKTTEIYTHVSTQILNKLPLAV